jgi:hypothetical protein
MGRPTEGWKLRTRKDTYTVRFTAPGRGSIERSTGVQVGSQNALELAAAAAARIYAQELSAPARKPSQDRLAPRPIIEEGLRWLTAEEPLRDPQTNATYALYLRTHWAPFFGTVVELTSKRIEGYRSYRLGRVAASTVTKELSALRSFVRWLDLDVVVPSVPRRAVGVRSETHWTGTQWIAEHEAEAILACLSGLALCRYVFAYETSLRPESIDQLRIGEHWDPENPFELRLPREDDKAREGRKLPLSGRAAWALVIAARSMSAERARLLRRYRTAPSASLFPSRFRKTIKAAGLAVLGPERGQKFVPMDLRAAFITHALERTGNLPGVAYLAGHKQVTTTARYAKPNFKAAEMVISSNIPRP